MGLSWFEILRSFATNIIQEQSFTILNSEEDAVIAVLAADIIDLT
jgi:hypothetical protein